MKNNHELDDSKVRCIDGITRRYKKCVGYCNNRIHKGFLTAKLYREHECFKRNCTFFDAKENHPYILEQEERLRAKEMRKANKNNERNIIKSANSILPSGVMAVCCKHLYESTFFLAIYPTVPCDHEILNELHFDSKFKVYTKIIATRQVANIEYTYMSLLPETMRKKAENSKKRKR